MSVVSLLPDRILLLKFWNGKSNNNVTIVDSKNIIVYSSILNCKKKKTNDVGIINKKGSKQVDCVCFINVSTFQQNTNFLYFFYYVFRVYSCLRVIHNVTKIPSDWISFKIGLIQISAYCFSMLFSKNFRNHIK